VTNLGIAALAAGKRADTTPTSPGYEEIERLLREHGFLSRAAHRHLRHQMDYLQRRRLLVAVCPGFYVRAGTETDVDLRIRVTAAWHPDGILMGAAAARLSFDPDIEVPVIVMATRRKRRAPQGIRLIRCEVPDEHVTQRDGIRLTRAALTALDLSRHDDGAAIDTILREGLAQLRHLRRALKATPYRLGNPVRRAMVDDSRDEPWSPAERRAHRVLRDARITGWETNLRISLPEGRHGFLDIVFDDVKFAIEVDGYGYHGQTENRDAFELDRWKQACASADGWTIIRLTWRHLTEHPEWVVDVVRRILGRLRHQPRRRRRSPGDPRLAGAAA